MIDVRELRIGNWVKMNDKLICMDSKMFHAVIHGFPGYTPEPIPLTEEIILKCGFSCTEESETSKGFSIGENIVTYDYLVYLTWLKRIDGKGLDPYPFYRNGRHIVKYLHQIQNLHFALTGEELEFKQ